SACLLLAFGIGASIGSSVWTSGSVAADSDQVVEAKGESLDVAVDGHRSKFVKGDIRDGVVGYVRWIGKDGMRLSPVFQGDPTEDWLNENPPRVDENMERMLSRVGWKMQPERKFVSLRLLESGDDFTIPMDDVSFRYIGQRLY
ncbi:MAG: hypothetical protein AAFP90_15295, partial [Planctomycetota bacterium]